MIRFFFVSLFIGLYTLLLSLWAVLLGVVSKDGGRRVHFWAAVPWARGILRVSGVRVRVEGGDRMDWEIPRIFMANHQSAFDIFTLLARLPVDFKFILKRELMKIPIFGPAMRAAGYIAIDREDPRKAIESMNRAAEKMKRGTSVLIFPEGTRSMDGHVQAFKKGGFHLALKSGCDIVPVAILNSFNILKKRSLRINRGNIVLRICEPISLKEMGRRDLHGIMERVRKSMIHAMVEAESAFEETLRNQGP